jgi:putative glutamine amidotransferase
LIQDVPTATGVNHSWATRYDEHVHQVAIAPQSRLAGLLGADEVGTNSLHHQAVGRPGTGVAPVAWAPDGTVEAFEVDGRPEVVAVQWHPELMATDAVQQRLFGSLVDTATRRVI